jgi:very-short-patch-repair endonuclease
MTQLNNLKYLKSTRQNLRNDPTPAEKRLWDKLRNSQLAGKKFRQQHSIGNYILDFYCPQHQLAIELDGDSHFTESGIEYDAKRTFFLNKIGIQVLRFTNTEVLENLENVLERIRVNLDNYP